MFYLLFFKVWKMYMYSDLWFLWKLTRNVLDSFAHISKDQLLTQSSKQDLQKERELGFNHVSIVKLIFYLWKKNSLANQKLEFTANILGLLM